MRFRNAALVAVFSAATMLAAEAGHGAAAEHGDPLLTAKWINFAILAAGLGYLFVKFAFPAFRSQQQEILASMDLASKQAEQVAARAREIDAQISNLSVEVESLRAKAMAELQNEAKRMEQETVGALAKVELGAQAEIASAAKAARKELAAKAAELAFGLAERKVVARMTPAVQAGLVDRFASQLQKRAGE